MLLLKILLVPVFIVIVTISGRLWGSGVAGLLSGLPIIAGPIIGFIYLEKGLAFAQSASIATLSGIIPLSTFCFTYSWVCRKYNWQVSYILSITLYFLIAITSGLFTFSLNQTALAALIVILVQLRFSPTIEDKAFIAAATTTEILSRMFFALVLVLLVTHFAEELGYKYSGIFAAFPIAGSAIALFSHRNHSALHAIKSLKSMKQGLLGMLAFFYILAIASTTLSFFTAIFFAALTAIVLQAAIIILKHYYKSKTITI